MNQTTVFPGEIYLLIVQSLDASHDIGNDRDTLASLRATCMMMNDFASRYLFKELRLKSGWTKAKQQMLGLSSTSKSLTHVRQFYLHIDSFVLEESKGITTCDAAGLLDPRLLTYTGLAGVANYNYLDERRAHTVSRIARDQFINWLKVQILEYAKPVSKFLSLFVEGLEKLVIDAPSPQGPLTYVRDLTSGAFLEAVALIVADKTFTNLHSLQLKLEGCWQGEFFWQWPSYRNTLPFDLSRAWKNGNMVNKAFQKVPNLSVKIYESYETDRDFAPKFCQLFIRENACLKNLHTDGVMHFILAPPEARMPYGLARLHIGHNEIDFHKLMSMMKYFRNLTHLKFVCICLFWEDMDGVYFDDWYELGDDGTDGRHMFWQHVFMAANENMPNLANLHLLGLTYPGGYHEADLANEENNIASIYTRREADIEAMKLFARAVCERRAAQRLPTDTWLERLCADQRACGKILMA